MMILLAIFEVANIKCISFLIQRNLFSALESQNVCYREKK